MIRFGLVVSRWVALLALIVAGACGCGSGGFRPVVPPQSFDRPQVGARVSAPSGPGWLFNETPAGKEWSVMFMHPADHADGRKISETATLYVTFTRPDYESLRRAYPNPRDMLKYV